VVAGVPIRAVYLDVVTRQLVDEWDDFVAAGNSQVSTGAKSDLRVNFEKCSLHVVLGC
jgi:hypothetical protein